MSTSNEPCCNQDAEPLAANIVDCVAEPQPSPEKESTDSVAKRKIDDITEETQPDIPPSKVPKTCVKDKTHWYSDGNVVFQIGDTGFKIYGSRMSRESSWFSALMHQRANGPPSKPYHHQSEIDQALKSVERRGKLDLFYLDFQDGPTAEQFGKLLSAMENGVDYVHDQPSFDVMSDIYETAHFFCMSRYTKYVEQYLKVIFPDYVTRSRLPSPYAARGLLLGLKYDFTPIIRPCYYDLAQIHPLQLSADENPNVSDDELNDDDSDDSESEDENDTIEGITVLKKWRPSAVALENAPATTFLCLLNIQREIALCWDRILDHLTYQCSTGKCKDLHQGFSAYRYFKKHYPFDPVNAIWKLVAFKDPVFKKYCSAARDEVKTRLTSERDNFWDRIELHVKASPQQGTNP